MPKIQINENFHFHSIPEGTEIQPFISALSYKSNPPGISLEYEGIDKLPSLNLLLFVSPHCPNCPSVIQKILPMVWLNPSIDLTVIDVGLFPEEAETRGIQSVPTLIYKDFQWTGPVKISEIMNVIQNSPDQWDIVSLERMLSEGKAVQLAQTILDNGQFVRHFDQLIAHDLLSVRLGAMVCVEYIAEENRSLAQELCDTIWQVMSSVNTQVQGDLIYLIGICGTEKDKLKLIDMATQANDEDIKESINEAIETIQEQL
jgi:thiol-disulfide isomerase/thioredoxin